MTQEETLDFTPLEQILDRYEGQQRAVIPVLQQAQEAFGYLPLPALEVVARRMKVPLSRVYGVATFYSQFSLTPRGRHTISQCDGTACHVRGSVNIIVPLSLFRPMSDVLSNERNEAKCSCGTSR